MAPTQLEWPIDRDANPTVRSVYDNEGNFHSVECPDLSVGTIFERPFEVRVLLLRHLQVDIAEQFNKPGYMTVWLTKSCPIGCEFCFFHSPVVKIKDPKNSLTAEGMEKLVLLIQDANIQRIMISGGGEPFMVFEQSMSIILKSAPVKSILIATGADWARKPEAAKAKMHKLLEYRDANKSHPEITLRISLDKYHAEKISPDGSLEYVKNIIDVFRDNFRNWPNYNLSFRALYDDPLVQDFFKKLPVLSRIRQSERSELVTLESGLPFTITYNTEFVSSSKVDLNNTTLVDDQEKRWDDNIENVYGGNMSVTLNPDGKGLNLEVLHNGEYFPWGASSPDNELCLYQHGYREGMDRLLGDVVSLSFMDKGNKYRDAVISEVDPRAIRRGKAIGIRDFYPRVILEEEKTRLYYAIRAAQDYHEEGKIRNPENLPPLIQQILKIPKEALIALHRSSNHTIATQYGNSEGVTLDHLKLLLQMVRLGHYEITEKELFESIRVSELPEQLRELFLQWVSSRAPIDT